MAENIKKRTNPESIKGKIKDIKTYEFSEKYKIICKIVLTN